MMSRVLNPLLLVLARHKRTENILMKLGHLQAYRSMPQNFAGWLVRCFRSRLPIRSMSSLASSKSKTLKFSSNLSSFDVFGMTTVFRWMPHRRTTWGTVFLYFSARPWSQRNKKTLFCKPALMVDLCKRRVLLTLRAGSSKHDTEPNHSVLDTEPPRGVWAVTQIPCFWQNLTRESRWK